MKMADEAVTVRGPSGTHLEHVAHNRVLDERGCQQHKIREHFDVRPQSRDSAAFGSALRSCPEQRSVAQATTAFVPHLPDRESRVDARVALDTVKATLRSCAKKEVSRVR